MNISNHIKTKSDAALESVDPLNEHVMKAWFDEISPELWSDAMSLEKEEVWVEKDKRHPLYIAVNKLATYLKGQSGDAEVLIESPDQMSTLISALSYTSSRRSFRLLGILANKQPGIGGDLLENCVSNLQDGVSVPENNIFHARVRILLRMHCYRRIFNIERRAHILKIINKIKETNE